MGTRERSGAEGALDKALGRVGETAGRVQGDKSLEAEERVAQRLGERKTYFVTTHADGAWMVKSEGVSRATSVCVYKIKGEAVVSAKELARSKPPSQLLVYNATVRCRRSKPTTSTPTYP